MMTRKRISAGDENATARVTRASKAGKGGAKGGAGGLCAPTTRSSGRRALGELSTNTGVARSSSATATATESKCGASSYLGACDTPAHVEPMAPFDAADADDPLCVVEYVAEIYEHHFATEAARLPSPTYMNKQPDLNAKMRAILIDWLSEVNDKYRLRSETLYLAVNLIDRFLAVVAVDRKKLQLVGVTGLLLAAKYVEIYPPQLEELVRVSGRAYTRDEILSMEHKMLGALGFHLSVPTPYVFLIRFLKAAGADAETAYRARYFLERGTLEYRMLKYIPSVMAASAVYMALRCRGDTGAQWTRDMARYTKCDEPALRPCVTEMVEIINGAEKDSLQGVRRKYASSRFLRVALNPLPEEL